MPLFVMTAFLAIVSRTGAEQTVSTPSPNECFPNGSFEATDASGTVAVWGADAGGSPFAVHEGSRVVTLTPAKNARFSWATPNPVIEDAEYVLRWRVKADNVQARGEGQGMRFTLQPQSPDGKDIPYSLKFSSAWRGTFDWKPMEMRFRMPRGAARFVLLCETRVGPASGGLSYLDDVSLRPVDDRPLSVGEAGAVYGNAGREQMIWVWTAPQTDMGSGGTREVLIRRTIVCPKQISAPQIVFTGVDPVTATVNGKTVGISAGGITRLPLTGVLKPGTNVVTFAATHSSATPGGIIGHVEWKNWDGTQTVVPTNPRWEGSTNGGQAWQAAHPVAVPVFTAPTPVPTDAVSRLPRTSYALSCGLPRDLETARLAVRATGGFRVAVDGLPICSGVSHGREIRIDLRDALRGGKTLRMTFEDVGQPTGGQVALEIGTGGIFRTLTTTDFRTDARKPPARVSLLYPGTEQPPWPHLDISAFFGPGAAQPPRPDRK